MNILQAKSNQFLRDAIFDGDISKIRKMLTLKFGKAEVNAISDNGGFSMLHCAALAGYDQVILILLQFGADINALTEDGYSALDLAIWKGYQQVADILRANRCIAPMLEPESLNGKLISFNGRCATVVHYQPCHSPGRHKMRALHFEDGENCLVNLWAGIDYKIIGNDPNVESLKILRFSRKISQNFDHIENSDRKVVSDTLDQMHLELNSSNNVSNSKDISLHSKGTRNGTNYANILNGDAYFDEDSDSDNETEITNIVEILVPCGPLGVLLNSGIEDRAVVQGFTNLPNGNKGVIEMHGGIAPGSYIVGINEVNASMMTLQQVTQLLGKLSRREKKIRFATAKEVHPTTVPLKEQTTQSLLKSETSDAELPLSILSPLPPSIPTCMNSPKAATSEECIHCGLPSTVHQSDDCPYR